MYKCSYTCTLTNRGLLCKICCHLPKILSRCEVIVALDLLADDTMLGEFVVRWESCCKPRYRISRELCIKSRHQAIYARVRYISHPFNSIPDNTSTCSNSCNVPGWPDSVGELVCTNFRKSCFPGQWNMSPWFEETYHPNPAQQQRILLSMLHYSNS
jgi:hypothetical protein